MSLSKIVDNCRKRPRRGRNGKQHRPPLNSGTFFGFEISDFSFLAFFAFCILPPINTRRAGHNAKECGKMHMAATGQATTSTHPASKQAARRAHGPRRLRHRRPSPRPGQRHPTGLASLPDRPRQARKPHGHHIVSDANSLSADPNCPPDVTPRSSARMKPISGSIAVRRRARTPLLSSERACECPKTRYNNY